jgi:hypothetical protein
MYYCIGPLVAVLLYYPAQHLGWITKHSRGLLTNEAGQFDRKALLFTLINVVVQASIVILLNINFHLSILADLNIGIAQTVHASQAFFVAFLDFIIFRAILQTS